MGPILLIDSKNWIIIIKIFQPNIFKWFFKTTRFDENRLITFKSNKIIFKPFTKPELPEIKDLFDIEGLEKRLEAYKNVEWVGCEVSCETPKGIVKEKVEVRNFEDEFIEPYSIACSIAMLLAYHEIAVLNGIKIS